MYDDDEPCVWGTGDPALWALRARDRGDVETAMHRGSGDFPASWGEAPGSRYSEERARWVAAHVETHQVDEWVRGGSAKAALAMIRALRESD